MTKKIGGFLTNIYIRQIIKYSIKCLPELYYKEKNGLYEVLKNLDLHD